MNNNRFQNEFSFPSTGLITYIMSDAFRIHYNHGLTKALELAKMNGLDLQIILFRVKEENDRNNQFFTKGITGYQGFLSKFTNNIYYFEETSDFFYGLLKKSAYVIKDKAYLKEHLEIEHQIKDFLFQEQISLTLVESNVVVPVTIASNKEEYGARTIRPKIMSKIEEFDDIVDFKAPTFLFEQKAKELLEYFIDTKLKNYDKSNDPSLSVTSDLSPYLKYGFISPLEIYREVNKTNDINKESFIEELIVRRELSYNFVYYNKQYFDFNHITYGWAYQTMKNHIEDDREFLYTKEDYITFNTHDIYFNAAMKEMVHLGKMHGYMRMYWAKKVIEWSPTYEIAYDILISLNNYYFLDGNTPNGYTGVSWCFGKHDRAWAERTIFGKLRYMNQSGLKRKFDIDNYVALVNKLIKK